MLRHVSAAAPVYLVADEYSAELEQAAREARASLFGVKPAHRQWLAEWLALRSRFTNLNLGLFSPIVPSF
jgi:hypothetical protein